jgi:hypothetical protein
MPVNEVQQAGRGFSYLGNYKFFDLLNLFFGTISMKETDCFICDCPDAASF